MKLLFDFLPLLLFFAVFKFYDIFAATAVAMAAAVVQVTVSWLRTRRVEPIHLVALGVLAVFGTLTLILRDDTFIKWKPTIVYWLLGVFLVFSQFTRGRNAVQYLLGKELKLPKPVWKKLNFGWAIFFAFMGALNLYIAFGYALELDTDTRTEIWVNFKVFGTLALTVVFIIAQALYLARHLPNADKERKST